MSMTGHSCQDIFETNSFLVHVTENFRQRVRDVAHLLVETPGGVLGIMGRHVCFNFLLLFAASGELTTERIELKFSLKIAVVPLSC
ncbi:MAG: hypothetical protein GY696_37240 [Gammaproteobacteria bacterium]|nr:hypothetical protein [Gammaproteobacteria bacterium]